MSSYLIRSEEISQLIGLASARALVQRQMESGRLAHAYLLVGPASVGKTTLARALAQTLLPEAALGRHPDYWEDDEERALGIDSLRGGARWAPDPEHTQQSDPLQTFLSARAMVGQRRVAVLVRAQRMELEAANALLKTLEEPPAGAILILTTENLAMLPRTVVSRCQVVHCEPVGLAILASSLENRGIASELALRLAAVADGSPGTAIRAAADPEFGARADAAVASLADLHGASRRGLLDVAARMAESGRAQGGDAEQRRRQREQLLLDTGAWQVWLHDLMVTAIGAESQVVHRSRLQMLQATAASRSGSDWAHLVALCVRLRAMLRRYVPPQLALEAFLLEAFAPVPVHRRVRRAQWILGRPA